jgi:hypothetical protein
MARTAASNREQAPSPPFADALAAEFAAMMGMPQPDGRVFVPSRHGTFDLRARKARRCARGDVW